MEDLFVTNINQIFFTEDEATLKIQNFLQYIAKKYIEKNQSTLCANFCLKINFLNQIIYFDDCFFALVYN